MQTKTTQKLPPNLFKYRSLGNEIDLERLRKTLEVGEVHWSSPIDFNDPFDCAPAFTFPKGEKLKELSLRLYQKHNPKASRNDRRQFARYATEGNTKGYQQEFVRKIGSLMEQSSVYSLSANPTDILMWAHYANSHKGVCLRFHAEPLAKQFILLAPVVYALERPEVFIGEEEAIPLLEKMLLTKSLMWQYEQEWRILGYKQNRGPRTLPAGCLTGVVMGSKIDGADKAEVISMVKKSQTPVALYQAKCHDRKFQIDFLPVNSIAEDEVAGR